MRGKLIGNTRVMYEEDGFRKYVDILPETDTSSLKFGMEIDFELVNKLNEGVTYTSEDGWNRNPVEGVYARVLDPWEEIEQEYMREEYPVFGGPFTNALTPWEWMKKYYKAPDRK